MVSREQAEYLERIAWQAAKGIVGADAAQPGGALVDTILLGLIAVADDAYQRGVNASMIQLSIVPDGAKAVG